MAWDDTVGTVASIGSLLQIACEITKLSYSYLSSVRNAHATRNEYLKEVNSLVVILLQLERALKSNDPDILRTDGADDSLAQLQRLVSACQGELATIETTLGRAAQGVSRLLWPLKERELRTQIDTFQRYRSMFDSFASASILATTRAPLGKMDPLVLSHERSQLLAAFPPPIISKRTETCPGTGRWFFESVAYRQWLEPGAGASFLWCHGPPGVGKSGIASLVVKDLMERQRQGHNFLLCYFFCDFMNQEMQTAQKVLQCMVYQLISQGDGAVVQIAKDTLSHFDSFQNPDSLAKTVSQICGNGAAVIWVFDAEDEMRSSEVLMKYFVGFAEAGCRIMVTSRRAHGDAMANTSIPVLSIEITDATEDIHKFARSRLCDSGDSALKEQVAPDLIDRVVEKSNGIFLIAHVLIGHLLEQTSLKSMKMVLETTPNNIKEVFQSSLRRIDNQPPAYTALAHRVIGWIVNTTRPLTTDEITHAFAVEEDSDEIDREAMTNKDRILRVCAGLVVILDDRTVRLVHTSVFEFFKPLKNNLEDIQTDISQACIRYLRLKPMLMGPAKDVAELRKRFHDMPFLDYASHNWGYHITDEKVEKRLLNSVLILLNAEETRWSSFQALQFDTSIKSTVVAADIFTSIPHSQDAIHLVAYWGLALVARELLADGHPVTPRDSESWTPLHWAAANGHVKVVEILANAGADLDAKDSEGWTPLFWAAFGGHASAVMKLLGSGADSSIRSNYGLTALGWAIGRNEVDVVGLLLRGNQAKYPDLTSLDKALGMSLDIEPIKKYGRWPKVHAYSLRSEKSEIDVDGVSVSSTRMWLSFYKRFHSPVPRANRRKRAQKPRPEFNVSTPINVDFHAPVSKSNWRNLKKAVKPPLPPLFVREPTLWKANLLQSAINTGNIPSARTLIELGADPNTHVRDVCPIYSAVRSEDVQFLEFLLQSGAEVDFEHNGGSPLIEAVREYSTWGRVRASVPVVEALLNRGARIDQTESEGSYIRDQFRKRYSPLMHVIDSADSIELAQILIARGANVNALDGDGNTPLHIHMAAVPRDLDTVKLLLANGADIHVQNWIGQTVLHVTASLPGFEMLTLILENGAWQDLHLRDKDGRTPFQTMIEGATIHLFTPTLLEKYINLFARFQPLESELVREACQDGKAVMDAVTHDAWSVLEVLLRYGAAVPPSSELLQVFYSAVLSSNFEKARRLRELTDLSIANRHIVFMYLLYMSTKVSGRSTFDEEDIPIEAGDEQLLRLQTIQRLRVAPQRSSRDLSFVRDEEPSCRTLEALNEIGLDTNMALDEAFVNAVAYRTHYGPLAIRKMEQYIDEISECQRIGATEREQVFITPIAFAAQHIPSAQITMTLLEMHKVKNVSQNNRLRIEALVRSAVYDNMAVYVGLRNAFLSASPAVDMETTPDLDSSGTFTDAGLFRAVNYFQFSKGREPSKYGESSEDEESSEDKEDEQFYYDFCGAVQKAGLGDMTFEANRTLLDLAKRAGDEKLMDALVREGIYGDVIRQGN